MSITKGQLSGIVSGTGTTNVGVTWTDGPGGIIGDGTWGYNVNDWYPLTTGSNIGDSSHRVSTIYLASTFDFGSDLTFVTSSTEMMRLTTSGFLGIGTTSPVSPLNITSITASNSIYVQRSDNGVGYRTDTTLGTGFLTIGAIEGLEVQNNSANIGVGTSLVGVKIINSAATESSEGLNITVTGGTTYNFGIRGSINAASSTSDGRGIDMFVESTAAITNIYGGLFQSRRVSSTCSNVYGSYNLAQDATTTTYAGYFEATGAPTNYAIYSKEGYNYFNRGTFVFMTPASNIMLGVNGFGSTSATYTAQFHNNTGSNNALIIRDDGNIGIGTSSPTEKLYINGTSPAIALKSSGWSSPVYLQGDLTSNQSVAGGDYFGINLPSGKGFVFAHQGLYNLYMDAVTSNWGVNTNTPDALFKVTGTATSDVNKKIGFFADFDAATTIANDVIKVARISGRSNGTVSGITMYGSWVNLTDISGGSNNNTNIAGFFNAQDATNNYAIIVPPGGGSVGIGTSTPLEILHIKDSVVNSGIILENTNTTTNASVPIWMSSRGSSSLTTVSIENSEGYLVLRSGATTVNGYGPMRQLISSAGDFYFNSTPTQPNLASNNISNAHLYISNTGQIGMNTISPSASTVLTVRGTGSTSATYTTQFHNSTGSSNSLMIRDDGYVGIGINSPSYALHVSTSISDSGTVFCENSFSGTENIGFRAQITNGSRNTAFYGSLSSVASQKNIGATLSITGASPLNYAIQSQVQGGTTINFGFESVVDGLSTAVDNYGAYLQPQNGLNNYGVYSTPRGNGYSTNNYGFYTDAQGATNNYGVYSVILSANTLNVGGYFKASGATNNYAIIVPTSGGSVGIGTSSPTDTLHVVGTLKYVDTNQASGKVLTSDTNGVASWNPNLRYKHTIFTPTTGGTVNLVNNQYNIINPAVGLLTLTVNLPSSPSDSDVVYIKFTQTVSTVTYGNGTVVDGITAPTAGGLTVLVYDSGTTSWY